MGVKISGEVVGGNRIGRTLGFPTANVVLEAGVDVASGVYAARAEVAGEVYGGMANVGYKPSVSGDPKSRVLEINLFDFDDDIYGERIEVELLEYVREERKFETLDGLKTQVDRDRSEIKEVLKQVDENGL